jgi:DMSO/TMAO reductase YedYZ molybdopterin-dependent catalytic subunit
VAVPAEPPAISAEELQLAARNHGMPLEALRHDLTPLGLHYLLVHYDVPVVDAAAWRLEIGGRAGRPLSLSLDDLRARSAVTQTVTMECAGNGRTKMVPRAVSQPWVLEAVGTAAWTGVPLRDVLADAQPADDAVEVVFTGLDRGVEGGVEQVYQRSLPLAEALREDVLLAYEVGGVPLPPQHGFPLRLLVPGWYGMTSVKWLARIDLVAEPFTGYQQATAYRFRAHADDPGTPLTRIAPRSLIVPPGVPEFLSRHRFVAAGPVRIEGRAWSGHGAVERVELSADAGATWVDAELAPPLGPAAWRGWSATWDARAGDHVLCSRATDATGRTQPAEAAWNVGGYANNAWHRVPVTVRGSADR